MSQSDSVSGQKASIFTARQLYNGRYMLSPVHPSVRPSVIRVDQIKTVKVRIMQLTV